MANLSLSQRPPRNPRILAGVAVAVLHVAVLAALGRAASEGERTILHYYGAWTSGAAARPAAGVERVWGYLAEPVPGNRGVVVLGARPAVSGAADRADILIQAVDARGAALPPEELRFSRDGRDVSMTPSVLADLNAAAQAFEEAWAAGDLVAHVEADLAFHLGIATACPNRMLSNLYRTVRQLVTETQRHPIPNTNPDRMLQSIAEHWAIVEALDRGDSRAAGERMHDHVRNTARGAGVEL